MSVVNLGPPVAAEQRVNEYYVWVAVYENGGEGVCAVLTFLGMTPAAAGDERTALLFEAELRQAFKAPVLPQSPSPYGPKVMTWSRPVRLELRRFGAVSRGDGVTVMKVLTP